MRRCLTGQSTLDVCSTLSGRILPRPDNLIHDGKWGAICSPGGGAAGGRMLGGIGKTSGIEKRRAGGASVGRGLGLMGRGFTVGAIVGARIGATVGAGVLAGTTVGTGKER